MAHVLAHMGVQRQRSSLSAGATACFHRPARAGANLGEARLGQQRQRPACASRYAARQSLRSSFNSVAVRAEAASWRTPSRHEWSSSPDPRPDRRLLRTNRTASRPPNRARPPPTLRRSQRRRHLQATTAPKRPQTVPLRRNQLPRTDPDHRAREQEILRNPCNRRRQSPPSPPTAPNKRALTSPQSYFGHTGQNAHGA